MDVHPTKNGIFIGIDPYPYIELVHRDYKVYKPTITSLGGTTLQDFVASTL